MCLMYILEGGFGEVLAIAHHALNYSHINNLIYRIIDCTFDSIYDVIILSYPLLNIILTCV